MFLPFHNSKKDGNNLYVNEIKPFLCLIIFVTSKLSSFEIYWEWKKYFFPEKQNKQTKKKDLHASFTIMKNEYAKKCLLLFWCKLLIIFSHSFSQIDINEMNQNSNLEPNINQFYRYMDMQEIKIIKCFYCWQFSSLNFFSS